MSQPARTEKPQPPRPPRRGRIVLSLLAVFTLVGLAPLATVAWKLIDINREALTTAQQEYQLLLASAVATELDVHVDGFRAQLGRVARALAAAPARSEGEIRRVLADVADDRMVYLRFVPLGGRPVGSVDHGVPEHLETLFAQGLGQAAAALAEGRDSGAAMATSSPPLLLDGSPPRVALVLSAPVASAGRFRGVLSAVVDLQAVWDEVIRDHPGGHELLGLDRRCRVFAHSGRNDAELGLDMSRSELARRLLRAEGRARETFPFLWAEDGRAERHLGSYEITREGWAIVVHAREQQVYLPVRAMVESTVTWAIGALSLAILAAVFFARTLSTPIDRLASASRRFAAGDFAARVDVRSRNEIGELADTFNLMASEIEGYIRRLKQAAEENTELFLGTIRALAQAIDAKDPYTRGHSVRVHRYAELIGRNLGLTHDELRDLQVSSLLHDVGKIGIDDAILKKAGPLTREEFEIMKTHPVLGAVIMAPIPKMKAIIPGLRSHHERWSGGGYPDGLAGTAIPLQGRIIAVADTFDAMTTHRPYQRAMSFEEALARINDLKGVTFDEQVVEAFNAAYQAGDIRPEETSAAPRQPLAIA